ncbi:DUF424 family protein [Candidatus Woesearchaeota archaeon]|nr:DUF424 family protein [Candidatus Woesearchaeota archaeon]
MMIVKVHIAERRKIVSICDANLIGKKFEDKNLQLDVSGFFYNGQALTEKEILKAVADANSLNIVGKESINFSLKNNLIDESNIITIKKIPHAISILR